MVAQLVKNLPAMQETWFQSLGQEDPLEKEMATPVFLPGKSHGQRSPTGYSPWGCKKIKQNLATKQQPDRHYSNFLEYIGERK